MYITLWTIILISKTYSLQVSTKVYLWCWSALYICLYNCILFVNAAETKHLARQLKESSVHFDSQFESLLHCCAVGHWKTVMLHLHGGSRGWWMLVLSLLSLSYTLWDLCPDTIPPYVRCYCNSYLSCLRLKSLL